MRAVLLITAAALALTACGSKSQSADANLTDSNTAMTDNMSDNTMVAANDSGANGTADNGAATAAVATPDFVKNAALSDMYEITASKLAVSMAQSADVKKFAANMITAHTATTAGLKAAIAKDGVKDKPPVALDPDHQAMITALKGATGPAFDTAYKAQQTTAHTNALALMQSYAASGDQPALKSFAASTAPKVQSHLDMLKTLS